MASVLHALGPLVSPQFPAVVDLFLVLAVWTSLSSSMGWSAVGGSIAGLCRDALSGGLYGLHGFADTLVAYLSARIQHRLLIRRSMQIGLLFAVAAALQVAVLATLKYLLLPGSEMPGFGSSIARMVVSGTLGVVLSVSSSNLLTYLDRRREQRRKRLKL